MMQTSTDSATGKPCCRWQCSSKIRSGSYFEDAAEAPHQVQG